MIIVTLGKPIPPHDVSDAKDAERYRKLTMMGVGRASTLIRLLGTGRHLDEALDARKFNEVDKRHLKWREENKTP